jgi:hypothetical protein
MVAWIMNEDLLSFTFLSGDPLPNACESLAEVGKALLQQSLCMLETVFTAIKLRSPPAKSHHVKGT